MANSDIFVTFGGDIGALQAACAAAKAQIAAVTREMATAAREFNRTGAAADSELGQKLKRLGDQAAATRARMDALNARHADFAQSTESAGTFKKKLDQIAEFTWQTTSLSGAEIDHVVTPLKMMAGVLGVAGTVGVASALAVGGALAYLQYRAYEAEVAVKSVSSALSYSGQLNAFGGFSGLQSIMQQATRMQSAWDVMGQGGAMSNEEAQKFATELASVQNLTGKMAQAFTDLAREERYAFGQDGLTALQNFVSALKQPEAALQSLISHNSNLSAAQRQQAQTALESGNAQKQASTYFDLVTQDMIRQKTEAVAAKVAHSNLSTAVKEMVQEALVAARSGGDLVSVLNRLSGAGVSAAANLAGVVGAIRNIRGEMAKGSLLPLASDLQMTMDRLDPASTKVRQTNIAWQESKSQVSALAGAVADLENKQATLNATIKSGSDADGRMRTIAAAAAYVQSKKVTRDLADLQGRLRVAQENEQMSGRDNRAAVDARSGKTALEAATQQIELKYSVSKDEVAKAKETTQAIQAELDATPDNEHFVGKRRELGDKLKESQKAEAEAAKAVTAAKIDYDIDQEEKGEAKKKLIRQKYAAEMAGIAPGTAEYWTKKKEMEAALEGAEPDKAKPDNSQRQADLKALDDQIKAAQQGEHAKAALYAEGARLFLLSEDDKVAATRRAVEEEYQAEKSLLDKELQIGNLSLTQKQAIENKKKALEIKYAADIQKLAMEAAQAQMKPWTSMIDAMSGSMSSGIMGMIKGTQNFQQAMAGVAGSIVQQFVKMGVDMIANWAKAQLMNVALSQTSEGQKTAAALAGATARLGITASTAGAGVAAEKAAGAATITGDAAKAAAGAYASVAQIPIVGWIMAPAAAAAAFGAVEAFGAFDVGAWSIDKNQLAMVHKGEMIMTPGQSQGLRNVIDGAQNANAGAAPGGAAQRGDTHVHLNVTAMDSASVKNWLSGNSRTVMKALNNAVQNGDHLGLRRLAVT